MPRSRRLSLVPVPFLILLACLATPGLAQPSARAPKGHLLIIGGNGTTDDIVKRAVSAGGGATGRVVIFPQASELPETGAEAVKTWTDAGFGHAVVADTKDPEAAIRLVREATFIWFPGGDQTRLMKAFENTDIPEAIRASYARRRAGRRHERGRGGDVAGDDHRRGRPAEHHRGQDRNRTRPRTAPSGHRRSALPQAAEEQPVDQRGARPPGPRGRGHRRDHRNLRHRQRLRGPGKEQRRRHRREEGIRASRRQPAGSRPAATWRCRC